MRKISLLILMILFAAPVWAEPHNHEENEVAEIEMTDTALQTYGIQTQIFAGEEINLPKSAVVQSRDEYFVYKKEGVHFQEIEIHPEEITPETVSFHYHTDEPETEFVISGAPYLRIVFLNHKNPIEGHVH